MMATCPICGKLTAIFWPQFWVYKRGSTYYCSENCMVVDQTRDIKLMNQVARDRRIRKGVEKVAKGKLTQEQKQKAIEIAGQGGDQLAYLKECGMKNPSAAWVYIKKTAVKKNKEQVMAMPQIKSQDQKPILADVAEKVPAVDMAKGADVCILSAACKGFIFTNLNDGVLIEKTGKVGQSLTIDKDEFGILMDALPKVAAIFKGGK